jgi:hypothetical protein
MTSTRIDAGIGCPWRAAAYRMRARSIRVAASLLMAVAALAAPLAAQSGLAAQTPRDWHALVGCYRVGDRFFALDSLPGAHPFQPPGGLQAWDYWYYNGRAYWRPLQGDSVEIGGGDSLHGWRFLGVARGTRIAGDRERWTDIAGIEIRPVNWILEREPCGTDGVSDEPPPNARMLSDSFPVRMAAVIADSLLPEASDSAPLGIRYEDNPYSLSSSVGQALVRRTGLQPGPDARSTIWMYMEDFVTLRDQASARFVTLSCPNARGRAVASRRRVRLRRERSNWVLAGIDLEPSSTVRCREVLRNTWVVRLLY